MQCTKINSTTKSKSSMWLEVLTNIPRKKQSSLKSHVCVYVCVCARALTEVCFDDVLVLCFVLHYVLSLEKGHIRVHCYYLKEYSEQ